VHIGIDTRLVHFRQAGISRYTRQLVEALARCETQDRFTLVQDFRERKPLVRHPSFSVQHTFTPAHHRLEQLILPLELSRGRFDVFHSPDFIPPLRLKTRLVITIHDLVFMLYPHFLTKNSARYYGQIDQAVRRADAIIAVSQATKEDVVRLLGVPEGKVRVIYEAASPVFRPLDIPDLKQRVRGRFGIRKDFGLFVSTIEPRKNVPMLLRAFRQFLDRYRLDLQLVLVGARGWLCEEAFRLIDELELQDDVLWVGRVPTQELVWLYNTAKFLVAPSIYEGFGLTPIEAMACGTPVIVSNVSALPEVVNDAGLLVDPHNPEEIAVAMWRIVSNNELRASLREKGFKRAAFFSWDKAARETLELYHSLA